LARCCELFSIELKLLMCNHFIIQESQDLLLTLVIFFPHRSQFLLLNLLQYCTLLYSPKFIVTIKLFHWQLFDHFVTRLQIQLKR
jgi:hypothetical protein